MYVRTCANVCVCGVRNVRVREEFQGNKKKGKKESGIARSVVSVSVPPSPQKKIIYKNMKTEKLTHTRR